MKIFRVYLKTLRSDMSQLKYVFEYTCRQNDDEKENNIIGYNNQLLHNPKLQPDFKYYQNHEFQKLSQSLTNNKTFSILQTNICLLVKSISNFSFGN